MQHWPSFGNHIAWQWRINSFPGLLDCVAIGFIFCGAWDHCIHQITSIKFPESRRVNVKLTFHWSGGSFWTCTSRFRLWRGAEHRIWMLKNQRSKECQVGKNARIDTRDKKTSLTFLKIWTEGFNRLTITAFLSQYSRVIWVRGHLEVLKNTSTLSVTKVCYTWALWEGGWGRGVVDSGLQKS